MSRLKSYIISFLVMLVLIPLGLALPLSSVFGQSRIMLVLGSADMQTLSERVQVANGLYRSGMQFDKIIVSGGCAAHGSGICEASEMRKQLIKLGVPGSIIIKEEKSKTTLQNYLYSRQITDEAGNLVIKKDDQLYVVSNHWHAIAVAGRFRTFDLVDAHYFISGNLIPKVKDPVDYVGIYHGHESQEGLLNKMLGNQVVAADYNNKTGVSVYVNTLGKTFVKNNKGIAKEVFDFWKGVPNSWDGRFDDIYIDAAKKNFVVFRKEWYHRFTIEGQYVSSHKLSDWIVGLPKEWLKRGVDAVLFAGNRVFVFSQDMLWVGEERKGRFTKKDLLPIVDFFQDWPFPWGDGDVDAALFIPEKRVIRLFRAKENVDFVMDDKIKMKRFKSRETSLNDLD